MTAGAVYAPLDLDQLEECRRLSEEAGWPHRIEEWELACASDRGMAPLQANG